jgi:hypothetical protein
MTLAFRDVASLAILPLLAGAALAACGGGGATETGTTTGTGGSGGGASTSSSSSSSTSSSSTTSSSGTAGAGGMLDNGMPSDKYPAPHPAAPQVVDYGGPVLHNPNFVPVFFANDDAATVTALKDFDAKVGGSAYWAANTVEYFIAPATSSAPIDLAEDAPTAIDDTAIQTWLADKLTNDPAFPMPDGKNLYILHYPVTTNITLQGSGSCSAFGGYHSNLSWSGQDVAYAVIPRCPNFGNMSVLDATTATESHEMLEAATDPYPMSNPAYTIMDNNHLYWLRILGGGETGDMCAQFESSYITPADVGYLVQRSWSNKAAGQSHDPCVPAPVGQAYFNAVPVLSDTITAKIQGQSIPVKGVQIALNETKTIDVDLFSDGDTGGAWDVEAIDAATLFGQPAHLDLSLDRTSGQNGEKLHLTITVNSTGMSKTETFILHSTKNGVKNIWIGIVGN